MEYGIGWRSAVTVQLSLSRLLLNCGQEAATWAELLACEGELPDADESGRATWEELLAKSRPA